MFASFTMHAGTTYRMTYLLHSLCVLERNAGPAGTGSAADDLGVPVQSCMG